MERFIVAAAIVGTVFLPVVAGWVVNVPRDERVEAAKGLIPPGFDLLVAEGVPLAQVQLQAAGFSLDEARHYAERCQVEASFDYQREHPYQWRIVHCQEGP